LKIGGARRKEFLQGQKQFVSCSKERSANPTSLNRTRRPDAMPNAITELAMPAFYTGLEPDLAHSLREQADRIRVRAKKTATAIIEIGNDLLCVPPASSHICREFA
jgi:hypothetical protein